VDRVESAFPRDLLEVQDQARTDPLALVVGLDVGGPKNRHAFESLRAQIQADAPDGKILDLRDGYVEDFSLLRLEPALVVCSTPGIEKGFVEVRPAKTANGDFHA